MPCFPCRPRHRLCAAAPLVPPRVGAAAEPARTMRTSSSSCCSIPSRSSPIAAVSAASRRPHRRRPAAASTSARPRRAPIAPSSTSAWRPSRAAALARVPEAVPLYRYDVVLGGVALRVARARPRDARDAAGRAARDPRRAASHPTPRRARSSSARRSSGRRLGGPKSAGEGVVVGVLDTGIWPEHPSFADPDPVGEALSAAARDLARRWRARSVSRRATRRRRCACNNKLIGARHFLARVQEQRRSPQRRVRLGTRPGRPRDAHQQHGRRQRRGARRSCSASSAA